MISESVVIDRAVIDVYRAFADLRYWKTVLPDVLGVEVLYDDGRHQEFLMTVARPAGPETVRGIRFCEEPGQIRVFQPVPPPRFRKMVGEWTFTEESGRTRVTATRSFELAPDPFEDREEVHRVAGEKLAEHLRANLGLFCASLERPR